MDRFACSLLWVVLAFAITTPAAAQTLVEKGNILYHNRCAGCHGEELKAFAGGPAFDLRRLRPDERDRFVESVISGKDNMPSWYGILKMDEIKPSGPTFARPWIAEDAASEARIDSARPLAIVRIML